MHTPLLYSFEIVSIELYFLLKSMRKFFSVRFRNIFRLIILKFLLKKKPKGELSKTELLTFGN